MGEWIEENTLHQYDLIALKAEKPEEGKKTSRYKPLKKVQLTRVIFEKNRIDYIIVKEGDTYDNLQKELGLLPFEIFKYNDLTKDSILSNGMELYIQPKRLKAARGNSCHIIEQGETMHGISQMYGVRLDRLYKMNLMDDGTEPVPDQKISLRKKLKGDMKSKEDKRHKEDKKIKKDEKPDLERARPLKEKINPEKDVDKIQFEFR